MKGFLLLELHIVTLLADEPLLLLAAVFVAKQQEQWRLDVRAPINQKS